MPRLMPSKNLPAPHQPDTDCCTEFLHIPRGEMAPHGSCRFNGRILLANSNQWYFNNLVKNPCHKTHCRCPHRLNLSFQSSRSCALPNIKVLKDKDLEFANSIRALLLHLGQGGSYACATGGSAEASGGSHGCSGCCVR